MSGLGMLGDAVSFTEGTYLEEAGGIDQLAEMVSLEENSVALEGMVADMSLAVSDKIQSSISGLAKFSKGFSLNPFKSNTSKLKDKAASVGFMEIGSLSIAVPDSFKGYMLDYTKLLTGLSEKNQNNLLKVMEKHEKKLSYLVNQQAYGTNFHYSKVFREETLELNRDKSAYSKFFPNNTGAQLVNIKDVYGNWGEILATRDLLNPKTASVSPADKRYLEAITDKVTVINALLLRVREEVKSEDIKRRIRTLKDIAGAIYLLAQQVEFFSAVTYSHYTLIELDAGNELKILKYKGGK